MTQKCPKPDSRRCLKLCKRASDQPGIENPGIPGFGWSQRVAPGKLPFSAIIHRAFLYR
jgi:hypothetical protein